MLNFIKKYKFILIFLLFVLFLLINTNVNASTINHNGNSIDVSHFEEYLNCFLLYDKTSNKYVQLGLLRTSYGPHCTFCTTNRIVIHSEDDNNITFNIICDHFTFNSYWFEYWDITTNNVGSFISSSNGIVTLNKNRYELVFMHDNFLVYNSDGSSLINHSDFFHGNSFPECYIEYNNKTSSYWVYTEWYDVREYAISTYFCYGEYKDFNLDDESQPWEFDNIITEMQYDELGNFTYMQREGFELFQYSYYSYCVFDSLSNEYVIYGLDFTEENYSNSHYFYTEYNENTCSYFVYTRWYNNSDTNKYYAYYNKNHQTSFNIHTYDTDGWHIMNFELQNENEVLEDNSKWRYSKELFDYGEYYFCLYDSNSKYHIIYKIVLTEDGNSYISSYNKNTDEWDLYNEIGQVSFENYNMYVIYDTYKTAVIYSNWFKYDDRYVYDITFSYDGINYKYDMLIENYGVDVSNNIPGYYRFYREVTENMTYYFRLQIFDPENNGNIVDTQYFKIIVDGIGLNIPENHTIEFYKNTPVYKFFKNNFGLLFYPIDLIVEFFDRLSQITESEPIINVPDIHEPFTRSNFYKRIYI